MAENNPIKATQTTFRIIETINELDSATVSDLSNELDLPTSTIHNYLKTLEENEYLVNNNGSYRVGLRFLGLGERARSRIQIYEEAKPELKKLATRTSELVNLVVEEHGRGIFIYRAKGNNATEFHTYVSSHVGDRVYLHSSASGKAILANLEQSRVNEILDRHGLPELTEQTIQDHDVLLEELDDIRENGVAFDYEEQLPGLWSVAVPVQKNDQLLGSISVSGPASRLSSERFEEELPNLLKEVSNVIQIEMAFR